MEVVVHGVIGDEVVDREMVVLGDAVPVVPAADDLHLRLELSSPCLPAATSGVVHTSTPWLTCIISSKKRA
jgi:hypothetical protein